MQNKFDGQIKIGIVAREALASACGQRFQIKTIADTRVNMNGRIGRNSNRPAPIRSMVMRR